MVSLCPLCHNHAMRRTGNNDRTTEAPRRLSSRGAAGPVAVFAVLLVLVALVAGAALYAVDSTDSPGRAAPTGSEESAADGTLTNEAALDRFEQLDSIRLKMFQTPAVAAIESAFVPGSPAARRVRRSLRELTRRRAFLTHPLYRIERLKIVSNRADEITIEQEVVLRTRIRTTTGRSLPHDDRRKRQTVSWVLKPLRGGWFFYDGEVTAAEFERQGNK